MTVQDFDPAERFVAGTVGPAGQRAFYLQARDGARVMTLGIEKQQVSILADRLNDILDELAPTTAVEPGQPGGAAEDTDPLETPFDEDWKVQTLRWPGTRPARSSSSSATTTTRTRSRRPPTRPILDPLDPLDPLDAPALAGNLLARNSLRVSLSPPDARAFARRSAALVSAGRPPCPFCGGPLDPNGHICPRANGYKR